MQKVITKKSQEREVKVMVSPELEGARLVLAGVDIDPVKVGFTDNQTIEMAKAVRTAEQKSSREVQVTKALKQKERVTKESTNMVQTDMAGIHDYVSSVIGISPSKSFSESIELFDKSTLSLSVTAVRKSVDSDTVKAIKAAKEKLTARLKAILNETGLKANRELMEIEAGTADDKSISLFNKDTKLSDNDYTYNVALKFNRATDDKC